MGRGGAGGRERFQPRPADIAVAERLAEAPAALALQHVEALAEDQLVQLFGGARGLPPERGDREDGLHRLGREIALRVSHALQRQQRPTPPSVERKPRVQRAHSDAMAGSALAG